MTFLILLAMVSGFTYFYLAIQKYKERDMNLSETMMKQNSKQTKLMEKQLENSTQQTALSKETADRMVDLAKNMAEFAQDMKEVKSDLAYIKEMMPEEEQQEVINIALQSLEKQVRG